MSDLEIIKSEQAPNAIGPYSQAVRHGNTLYMSGQIPLDPKTMKLVEGDIATQARQIFSNLEAVAQAAGGSLKQAVKITIYMVDISQFAEVNKVMEEVFTAPYPARATVGVAKLPAGAQVEADAILALG